MAKRKRYILDKKKQKENKKNEQRQKILKYVNTGLFICILALIFYFPYPRGGLFFEIEALWVKIIVFILFSIFWIYRLVKKDKRFLQTPIDYISLGFAAVYAIAILSALSTRQAIGEWLRYCTIFAVFYMLTELIDTHKRKLAAMWVILASGTGICILGIDGAAGGSLAKVINHLLKPLGRGHEVIFGTFEGNRIYSTLQYPNTLAGYLIAVFLISFALLMASKKQWQKCTAGALSFITFITFIFTLSRGGYLVMAGVVVLLIILLPKGSRISGIIYAAVPVLISGLLYLKMEAYVDQGIARRIWQSILAGMIFSAAGVFLSRYLLKILVKINWKVYAIAFAVFITAAAAGFIYMLDNTMPVELSHTANEKISYRSEVKSIRLKPGKEYIMEYEITADNPDGQPYACAVSMNSKSENNILFEGATKLVNEKIIKTEGAEKKSVEFKVPENSKLVDISFSNMYPNTSIKVENIKLVDPESLKTIKKLAFKYRFLPEDLISLMSNIWVSDSTLARARFYTDGLDIMKDYWLLGAGGGAWTLLYPQYQSYLYWSTQAHNYWLQLGIETGMPGLILFILLIAILILSFIKLRKSKNFNNENNDGVIKTVLICAMAGMLVHSSIDFDFSHLAVILVFWCLAALYNSYLRMESNESRTITLHKLHISPAILIIAALILSSMAIRHKAAEIYNRKGMEIYNSGEKVKGIEYANKSIELDKLRPHYKIDYANMVIRHTHTSQQLIKANSMMEKAQKHIQNDTNLLSKLAGYYLQTGNFDQAFKKIDRAVALRPLNPGEWHMKTSLYYQAAIYYLSNNKHKEGIDIVNEALEIINEAQAANEKNMNPFIFQDHTLEIMSRMKYIADYSNSGQTININDVIFYTMPSMDVDGDGFPDQWEINEEIAGANVAGKTLSIINKREDNEQGYITSRNLSLQPGRTYSIKAELEKPAELPVDFRVSGAMAKAEPFEIKESSLYGAFSTPEGYDKNSKPKFIIYFREDLEIKEILITAVP